jgi:hypothetical protein
MSSPASRVSRSIGHKCHKHIIIDYWISSYIPTSYAAFSTVREPTAEARAEERRKDA